MKTLHLTLAAAVLAAVSGSIVAQTDKVPSAPSIRPATPVAPADSATPAVPATGDKLQQLGSQTVDDKTAGEVRTSLADVINVALTENKFPDLIQHLAKPDRDRLAALNGEKFDDLNKAIAQFRTDFKARYHQEFQLTAAQLKDVSINPGTDHNLVTVSLSDLEKNSAVKPTVDGMPAIQPSLPQSKSVDEKNAPMHGGMSVVSGPFVNLINEGRTANAAEPSIWKVNIANEITARQLKENLTKHLQKLGDQKTTWSDDPNATARAAAAQVVQALGDSSMASEK